MKPTPPPDDAPALDAELVDPISAAIEPDGPHGSADARVKSRLLRRIAADSTDRHLTLGAPEGGWRDLGKGLSLKVLHRQDSIMSYLLRLAPGSEIPAHRHPIDEECVVLEGELRIGQLRLGAGGFHLGRKDVLHDRLHSPDGALIFLRGAVPEAALAI